MRTILLHILFIFCFGTIAINVWCQDSIKDHKFVIYSNGILIGSNYSWYKNSIGNYNLWNPEFYIGYSNRFIINNYLNINLSFHGGIKVGNPYKQRSERIQNVEEAFYIYFEVDKFDRLLSYNYYYLELPITVNLTILKRISLKGGYAFRYYLPQENPEKYSFIFDSNFEDGVISGASIQLSKNLVLNSNYIFAIKNSYSSLIITSERQYYSALKVRAIQLSLQYFFK
jgi:hypothetical protein